jgi:predicted RNA-binding protein
MEKRRNEMRKKLYDAQDDVDKRKEELIARVEVQLNQKSYTEPIFIISWHIL